MFVHVQIPQPITNDLTFITPICRAERFKILCLLARRQLSYKRQFQLAKSSFSLVTQKKKQQCLDVVKEEKVWEKEAPSVTGRCWGITSRVLPSLLSVVWLAEVVSNVSPDWSTRRPEVYSKSSWKTSSVMLSPTPNMPRGRPSQPWTLSTLWRGRDVPSTDSAVKQHLTIDQVKQTTALFRATHIFRKEALKLFTNQ